MKIIFLWAQDENGGFGLNNKLPWKINDEIQHFKKMIFSKNIIVGGKTYKNLPPKALLGSKSVTILNRQNIKKIKEDIKFNEYIVIGGLKTFQLLSENVNELWVSVIKGVYTADTTMNFVDFGKTQIHLFEKEFELNSLKEYKDFYYYEYKQII